MAGLKTPSYLWPLLWIALGGTFLILLAGFLLNPYFDGDSKPLLGAVIAGLASVVVFSFGRIAELFRDEAVRREKIADMVTAIFAEITASDFSADLQASEASEDYALEMVEVGEPEDGSAAANPEIPFAVPDQSNFVFEAISKDLSLLPQEIIHPIVLYYKLVIQTNDYVRTLSDPIFRGLSPERRALLVRDLVNLNRAQAEQGDRALEAIAAFAKKEGLVLPDAEATKARLRSNVATNSNDDEERGRA